MVPGRALHVRAARADRLHQVPELRVELGVLVDEHEADAGFLDVVGRDLFLVFLGLGVQQLDEVGVRLRHVLRGHEALVVDDRDGLEGRRVDGVLELRPVGQRADLGRLVGAARPSAASFICRSIDELHTASADAALAAFSLIKRL